MTPTCRRAAALTSGHHPEPDPDFPARPPERDRGPKDHRRKDQEAERPYLGRGLAVVPVRSTARARAVRVVTPILWKMLRRWVSTVFWLKNSSAAICGLVLRSTTSHASWSSRPVSDSMPALSVLPGRVRRWM